MKIFRDPPQPRGWPYDVFLSYNSKDAEAVEKVAQHLVSVGLKPWLDKWVLVPGEPWVKAMEQGIKESKCCAVFWGRSGEGSWQRREIEVVLREQVKNSDFRVIPVLLPGIEKPSVLPTFLSGNTWVELYGTDADVDALWKLECGVRGIPPLIKPPTREANQPAPQQLITSVALSPDLEFLPVPKWGFLSGLLAREASCFIAAISTSDTQQSLQLIATTVSPSLWPRLLRLEARLEKARIEPVIKALIAHKIDIIYTQSSAGGLEDCSLYATIAPTDNVSLELLRHELIELGARSIDIEKLYYPNAPTVLWSRMALVERRGIDSRAWRHLAAQALSLGVAATTMVKSVVIEGDTSRHRLTYTFLEREVRTIRIAFRDMPGALASVLRALEDGEFQVIRSHMSGGPDMGMNTLHALGFARALDDSEFKRSLWTIIGHVPPEYRACIAAD